MPRTSDLGRKDGRSDGRTDHYSTHAERGPNYTSK